MAYKHGMTSHAPSGHASGGEPRIHQKGMRRKAPSAVEPHPKGQSVNVGDRPSADYVPHITAPGPRNA